ncbi:InlB B-repeat-containing protein, partial [Bifidobacterium panos]
YTGFMAPTTVAQSKIAGDGSTVVKIQYTRDKYDVTFDANGHGAAPSGLTGVKYEAKVAKPGDPSEAGYAFGGWYTDAACADKDKWDFDADTMPAEKLTLYAKWTGNPYVVRFDANGGAGDMSDQSFVYGEVRELSANVFERDGYGFAGWNTQAGGAGVSYTDGQRVSDLTAENGGTVILYAQWAGNKYDITYNPDGGTLPADAPKTHTYGEETKLPTPTKDGYTFDGWYDEDGNKVDAIPTDAKDMKITAKWTADEYDITYDPNGGTLPADAPKTHTYGEETKLPTPTKDGYTFDGWYDEDGNKVDAIPTDAKDMKITAKWTADEYDITYDPNGGTLPTDAPKTHTYGQETKLPTPTRDGYTFDGWYDEAGKKLDTIPTDAKDMKVTAKWTADEYNITYDPNDGTLPEDAPKTHTYGQETKLPTPTKDGYTFDGWYDEAGNKVDTIPTDAKDTKVTAKWTADEYDITYNPDGGALPEGAPKTHTYGQETKLPTPTKDGYTFDGWYDENGNKVDTIPADAQDLKITAKWTADEYDITYDLNGGTLPADAPKTHTYGEETELPTPTRDGYTFDGWYDENGNKLDTIPADATDMKITAKWKGDEYNITYDPNGGTLPEDAPKTHTYGQETKLPTPTKDGYTFDGWYDEAGNKVDTIPADGKDVKITAKWTGNEYNITYDLDGGTLPADAPKTHTYGEETELPTPTRDGYTFDGWYDEDGNKIDTIPADAQDMKITAKWTKNADTDNGGNTDATGDNDGAKYDPNGGAMPDGWTGADGKLPTPTREGYKFDGWYDDEGNLVTNLKDAAGKTLHARWTKLNTLASTGATALAAGLTALALAAAGVTVGVLRRKRSR